MAMVIKGRTSIKRNAPEMTGNPLTLRKTRGRTIHPWLFIRGQEKRDVREAREKLPRRSSRRRWHRGPEGRSGQVRQVHARRRARGHAAVRCGNVAPDLRKAQRLVEAAKGDWPPSAPG